MKNLRLLVVLQHPVGVEGGSVVHLLHVRTRFLTLTAEERLIRKHSSRCRWIKSVATAHVNLLVIGLSAYTSPFEVQRGKCSTDSG